MGGSKQSRADVFFATPITVPLRTLSEKAAIEYLEVLKNALEILRSHTSGRVFLALEAEGWEDITASTTEMALRDYTEVAQADAVVALYPSRGSSSVLVELGWAAGLRKPILIAVDQAENMVPLVRGLSAITRVVITEFGELGNLCSTLEAEATAFLNSVRPA